MRYKTLFRIICKAIGVYFILLGTCGTVSTIVSVLVNVSLSARMGAQFSFERWTTVLYVISPLMQLAGGLYLFVDGRRVVDWAVPGNRPYCPECGYDLTAASGDVCPECGTNPLVGQEK